MTPRPRRRRLGTATVVLAVAVAAWLAWCNRDWGAPLRVEPLGSIEEPLVEEGLAHVVRFYAPWFVHEVDPERGRQDLPTRVDFDGDAVARDNWEELPRWELPPVVYYAVLETESHWFLTFHVYHPRDWATLRVGLHRTHENDGENVHVVVRKSTGRPEVVLTQAHLGTRIYRAADCGWTERGRAFDGVFHCVDAFTGEVSPSGLHPLLHVESGGHGITAHDRASGAVRAPEGALLLRPARVREAISEPSLDTREPVAYGLDSSVVRFWRGLSTGALTGPGRLFADPVPFKSEPIELEVPCFYDADRFSGPLGPRLGASPFAVDLDFDRERAGALFFDPAHRWLDAFEPDAPWETTYLEYPFWFDD